jgi:YD repeat-containing protein
VLGAVDYHYDSAGRRVRLDYPDGFFVTYAYNAAGDLSGIYEYGSGLLAAFEYDALGRRSAVRRGNGVTTNYGWDAASRLTALGHDPAV